MIRNNRKVIIGMSVVLLLLIITFPKINRFIEIDSCLDKGGSWNYEKEQCDTINSKEKKKHFVINKLLKDNIIYKHSIGNIKVGLSISDFQKEIEKSNRIIKREFINLEGDDYEVYSVYDNSEVLYKVEPDCDSECYVWRIWIYDESLKTEKGVGVGSSLGDILDNYKIDYLSTEEGIVIVPKNFGFSFTLRTGRLSSEWWSNPTIDKLDKNKTIVSEIILTK